MRVLVTGGCGYKGSVLVPKLLAKGHDVTVVDTLWFGNKLPFSAKLHVVEQDIRTPVDCSGQDSVIHLAGIANDPCGELDAKLTWEVNVLAHQLLCESAVKSGVGQFIYASSASVYGVKGDRPVTEEDSLQPISDYNKTKMCAERITLSYSDKMAVQIVRPATICGVSPRQRLDVVVNMLTMEALKNGVIEVKTPNLYRPHCHIEDVTDLYCWLLERPGLTGTFNAGFDNQTIMQTAELIAEYVGCGIRTAPHVPGPLDKRSYLVDSIKLLKAGFEPTHKVKDAVKDLVDAFRSGSLKDGPEAYNLAWMQTHGWVRS